MATPPRFPSSAASTSSSSSYTAPAPTPTPSLLIAGQTRAVTRGAPTPTPVPVPLPQNYSSGTYGTLAQRQIQQMAPPPIPQPVASAPVPLPTSAFLATGQRESLYAANRPAALNPPSRLPDSGFSSHLSVASGSSRDSVDHSVSTGQRIQRPWTAAANRGSSQNERIA